ncbi:two-component regulator propeller domain-containing protein [Paenibacillus sp. 1P03SA]|uniref:hybrid sensor histidine kinase/response regulator n=1 Tax=Paenibacillus sp. 1P03SA TaxID=3132294 RepID=UPI0039A0625F
MLNFGYYYALFIKTGLLLTLGVAVLSSLYVTKAEPPPDTTALSYPLRFQNLTINQGLSQNSIIDIVQDPSGFLWFGTQDGLNRYDGYSFVIYKNDMNDPDSLSDNWVTDLFVDSKGNLWVGTYNGGVNRYDAASGKFNRYRSDSGQPNRLSSDSIKSIKEDARGRIWIVTKDGGLNLLDPESNEFKVYDLTAADSGGPMPARISSMTTSPDGSIWIGTENAGVMQFDPEKERFVSYRHIPGVGQSLVNDSVKFVHRASDGYIWIGTDEGLDRYDPNGKIYTHYGSTGASGALPGNEITSIYEDSSRQLWIGTTEGLSLYVRSKDAFYSYRHNPKEPESLSGNWVFSIFEDASGSLWIGTRDQGINKAKPGMFSQGRIDNLDGSGVWSLYVDALDRVWVGTDKGIEIHPVWGTGAAENEGDASAGKAQGNSKEVAGLDGAGTVRSIIKDAQGNIWAGGDGGLFLFDRHSERFNRFQLELLGGLKDERIRFLYEDKQSQLWIGTYSHGLGKLDASRTRLQSVPVPSDGEQAASVWITSLLEDSSGNLWIGTNEGLFRMKDSMSVKMNIPPLAATTDKPRIRSILEASDGTIWIATFGSGFLRYKTSTDHYVHYTEKNGLANNTVYGILEDREGNLWLSTNRGLSKFDPDRETFSNYDSSHGLQSNEFNANAFFKFIKADDEMMVFGGVNGFNLFRPRLIESNTYQPPVRITRFDVPGRQIFQPGTAVEAGGPVTLPYQTRTVSFEFSSLDYTNPENNQYAYRLEGFDPDWVPAGRRRFASYTNLEPGTYTLHVKGTNSDGLWSGKTASFTLTVETPPWKTWWAYSLYAVTAALGYSAWTRKRTKRQEAKMAMQKKELEIREQELERERLLNSELTKLDQLKDEFLEKTSHELRTPLQGIIGMSESLLDYGQKMEKDDLTTANLSLILRSAQRLSHLVEEVMDLSKIKHEQMTLQLEPTSMKWIADTVVSFAVPLLKQKPVKLLNRLPEDLPLVMGDGDRLQQVMYNLIGNAIKFTEEGRIEVSAAVRGAYLDISVTDTGPGIPEGSLPAIFDAFEQDRHSGLIPSDGLGLGLAISKELIALHGGDLRVSSVLGEGSVFTFSIPLYAGSVPVQAETACGQENPPEINPLDFKGESLEILLPAETGDRASLLLVDDEPVILQVLINHLSPLYNLTLATDGEQALSRIESSRFDLVLLDVVLPSKSGYDVCKKIREQFTLHELPVILISAKGMAADMAAGYEAGANDYVTKPFTRQELLSRIDAHLQLKKMQKPLLTKQETRILRYIHQGLTNSQIEKELNITERTITNHVNSILKKTGAASRFEAARKAAQKGLLDV